MDADQQEQAEGPVDLHHPDGVLRQEIGDWRDRARAGEEGADVIADYLENALRARHDLPPVR